MFHQMEFDIQLEFIKGVWIMMPQMLNLLLKLVK